MAAVKKAPEWQPDVATIEWIAQEVQWELDRLDPRGPASATADVPAWLRRVAKDNRRMRQSRWPR